MTTGEPTLHGTFPRLFTLADEAADASERRFYRLTWLGLVLGLVAAVGGAASVHAGIGGRTIDVGAGVAVVAFAALFATSAAVYRSKPERRWYQARAVAESAKTLTWHYAVGGSQIPPDRADDEAERGLLDLLDGVRAGMDLLELPADPPTGGIPDRMRALRAAPPARRLDVYRRERIDDQLAWYRTKAAWNDGRARRLFGLAVTIQVLAIAAGVAVTVTSFDMDLLGIAAAAAAAVTAWQQAKDHDNLAEAYRVTVNDLEHVVRELPPVGAVVDDAAVRKVVDDAEQAISREHTVWRARRGVPARG